MKLLFFGTSSFAARILAYLIEHQSNIVGVVTRPDQPSGRGLQLTPSPVKAFVLQHDLKIPIFEPVKASDPAFYEALQPLEADLFVVVAYGQILKPQLLALPPKGCINVHASLLPKYRGANPIRHALMHGEKETGITIIDMVAEMDAGDMLAMQKIPVPKDWNFAQLDAALCDLAGPLLLRVINQIATGTVKRTPQNAAEVTFAPKLSAHEERIDWTQNAEDIHNQVRSLAPAPGAWCEIELNGSKKRLKILMSEVISAQEHSPGKVLSSDPNYWVVACGRNALKILSLQLEGKKPMEAAIFFRGLRNPIDYLK